MGENVQIGRSVPLDEQRLVDLARQGDVEAFGELVELHADLAFRTAYLVCGDAAEAEDAVQDALVAAHRAFGRFRPGAAVRPWLLRIVANTARNHRRSAARRGRLLIQVADSERSGGAAPSPESALEVAEERAALLRALAGLREEERVVVVCRQLLELDVAETAAVAGCREGTVKSRLSRGLAQLRSALEPGRG